MTLGARFAPLPDDFHDLCGGITLLFLGLSALVIACAFFIGAVMR